MNVTHLRCYVVYVCCLLFVDYVVVVTFVTFVVCSLRLVTLFITFAVITAVGYVVDYAFTVV